MTKIAIFSLLIIIGVIGRLIDHAPNFTPMFGIAIYAGYLFDKKYAILVPILALLISNCFLDSCSLFMTLIICSCFALPSVLGDFVKSFKSALVISFASPLIFFVVSNFAVWCNGWYSQDINGLLCCYSNAIPFFKYSVTSSIFFTTVLFGIHGLSTRNFVSSSVRLRQFNASRRKGECSNVGVMVTPTS